MRKIAYEYFTDSAKPQNATEPVHVITHGCTFDELQKMAKEYLKNLKPFNGQYQLIVEFSDPEINPLFNVGYVGARIIVRAETEELAKQMRAVL